MAQQRQSLQAAGTQLAFVFMGEDNQAEQMFAQHGLGDVPRFNDPSCILYRAFGLRRLPPLAFLKAPVVRRAIQAFRAGHRGGSLSGDGLRMPGVFLLHRGEILRTFRHETAADRPDYAALATCPVPLPGGSA